MTPSIDEGVRLVAFDLDDTLAPSKSPLPSRMVGLLSALTRHRDVAIISGGDFAQFRRQVIDRLAAGGAARPDRLHLMPVCGTQYHRWKEGDWVAVYAEMLDPRERELIMRTVEDAARALGLWERAPWGDILEDRGSQVTYSALGQGAPLSAKSAWDPHGRKRERLRAALAPRLPDHEIRVGGSTSIDVTRRGVDKGHGLRLLAERTGIELARMVFVGDQLQPGGNDHPAVELGMRTFAVESWEDTAVLLEDVLPRLSAPVARSTPPR